MSIIAYEHTWTINGLSNSERLVLLAIADHHNGKSGRCDPGYKKLCEKTRMSRRNVIRIVKGLEEKGALKVTRRKSEPDMNLSNSYSLPGLKGGDKLGNKSQGGGDKSGKGVVTNSVEKHTENVTQTGTEPEIEPEIETLSECTAKPAASSAIQTPEKNSKETPREKGEVLTQNFAKQCKSSPDPRKTRLRFYMECGRLHSDADHFHKPKNPKKPLKWGQLESLRIWFEQLPESGCDVMNYAMANWSRLRDAHRVGQTTPTISALEKAGAKELFDALHKSQSEAMLNRVAANLSASSDDLLADLNQYDV